MEKIIAEHIPRPTLYEHDDEEEPSGKDGSDEMTVTAKIVLPDGA